eukprot:TRINITY_DN221_c0_g1_i1.p1 TRINITY_DN221_c0_g1~~TRINITY_DN221_c0_g1_i1.p1  ORF type:complete len:186 (+),score=44.60 TRINITY_DN221_c0_g1_i1:33-560(+)
MKSPSPPLLLSLSLSFSLLLVLLLSPAAVVGKGNPVLGGYDIMSYWKTDDNNTVGTMGTSEFSTTYDGYEWYFTNEFNHDYFLLEPADLVPSYGGYCAYAAAKGELVCVQPGSWYLVNQRLFFFSGPDTGLKWLKEVKEYIQDGDEWWSKTYPKGGPLNNGTFCPDRKVINLADN